MRHDGQEIRRIRKMFQFMEHFAIQSYLFYQF